MEGMTFSLDGPADVAIEKMINFLRENGGNVKWYDRRKLRATKKAEREIRRDNRRIARAKRRAARKTK